MILLKFLGVFAVGLAALFGYTEWRYHRAVVRAKREKRRG